MGGRYKKSVTALPLRGKTVLIRADLDAPIVHGVAYQEILGQSIKTIAYCHGHGAKVVVMGHLLRPDGPDSDFSLLPAANGLSNLLQLPVDFVDAAIGPKVRVAVKRTPQSGVVLLQNLRFYPGEEGNDPGFAAQLIDAVRPDYYIQDDRRAVRHATASTLALAYLVPSVAGFNTIDIWGGPGIKTLLDA